MTKFMLTYFGGKLPSSKEESMAQREKWQAWIDELGNKIANPRAPFSQSKIMVTIQRIFYLIDSKP